MCWKSIICIWNCKLLHFCKINTIFKGTTWIISCVIYITWWNAHSLLLVLRYGIFHQPSIKPFFFFKIPCRFLCRWSVFPDFLSVFRLYSNLSSKLLSSLVWPLVSYIFWSKTKAKKNYSLTKFFEKKALSTKKIPHLLAVNAWPSSKLVYSQMWLSKDVTCNNK